MTQDELARRLRVLRAERGLSLTKAAERIGVTRDTLSEIERGKRHPYVPTLTKIAAGYGVPVEGLLEGPALAGKVEASEKGQNNEAGPRGFTRMLSREEVVNGMILAEKSEDAARDIINSIADSQVPVTRDTYKRIARQRLAEIADHEPQTLMDKRAERRLLALIEALNNPDAMTPYRIKQLVSEDVG